MAFATLTMMLLGRKIGLRDRMLLRESMNTSGLSGLVRLTRWYLTAALVIEGGGAVLLAIRFVPLLGWGKGVYFSIFHAVSAFCNAGFDLFGHFSSLTAFQNEPLVLLTISALIVLDCRMDARSTELKPAVRIVVDCMRAFTSLFPAPEMPPSVAGLCHSVRQKNVIPIKSSTPVMPSTNRLWSDNSRHWKR